jgi:hypothetical protein
MTPTDAQGSAPRCGFCNDSEDAPQHQGPRRHGRHDFRAAPEPRRVCGMVSRGMECVLPSSHAGFCDFTRPTRFDPRPTPAGPPPAPAAEPRDSGTYGELPWRIRAMLPGHEWDNMTRDEQRAWLITNLNESLELYEANHG